MTGKKALAFAVSLSVSLSASIVEKTFTFDSYDVESLRDGYSAISLKDAVSGGPAGDPGIPYIPVMLLLPPGEEAIAWEIAGKDTVEIPGTLSLFPRQPEIPLGGTGATAAFCRNESVYISSALYPPRPGGAVSTQYFNGYPVAMGAFTPVLYYPAQGKVCLLRSVRVTLRTRVSARSRCNVERPGADETSRRMLSAIVQNPEALRRYAASTNPAETGAKMLIITGKRFQSGFTPLMDHHAKYGVPCIIAFVEDILVQESGRDEQEKIRNRIIKEKNASGITHVLLGGDTTVVKARGFYARVKSNSGGFYSDTGVASDIYFSAIDGDWNKNGNGKWGEPGDSCDMLPDLSVGRLPVGEIFPYKQFKAPEPEGQLQNIVSKIISYQERPVQGNLNKPLLLAERADSITPGGVAMDLLIDQKSDNGFTTKGIPSGDNIQKVYDEAWENMNIEKKINEGACAMYHFGHGCANVFMGLDTDVGLEKKIGFLDGINENFTIVNSTACYGGLYTSKESLASQMLIVKTFAVAFIGNTWYGWYEGNGSTDGSSPRLQRLFVHALYTENLTRIGDAHLYSKAALAPMIDVGTDTSGGRRAVFYCCNLLGDPAMTVWIRNGQTAIDAAPNSPPQPTPGGGLGMECINAGPNVTVRFVLAEPDRVRLSLLDFKGRTIGVIANGDFRDGIHSVSLDMKRYARGCYCAGLTASRSGETAVIRLVNYHESF